MFRSVVLIASLFAAVGGSTWIDVPFVRQDENGCGSASIWMLMEYWRKSPDSIDLIHKKIYSESAGGVWASTLEQYLGVGGFETLAFSGEWADLVENIEKGRPLIVCLRANSRGTPLHYVVVAGIQEKPEAVLLNDPARRKLVPMEREEFERKWDGTERWTLLATPKEPAPESPTVPPVAVSSSVDLSEATRAFRREDYGLARRLAHQALQQSPEDPLIHDFLGTLYFLESNIGAALKYWNRIDKPEIRDVAGDLQPLISRSSVLRGSDYNLARKQLDASGKFSRYAIDLNPNEQGGFDLGFRAVERAGVHPLMWMRGLPYQSVSPELFDIKGTGVNLESVVRWKRERRRGFLGMSAPITESLRYRAGVDFRNEVWDGVPVRKREVRVGLDRIASSKWGWSSGVVAGSVLKYDGATSYDWLNVPERKLAASSGIHSEIGRSGGRFARLEADTRVQWRSLKTRLRGGRVLGNPPLGELFSIGLDRDHDLWMRGHSDRLIGKRYVLWNSEVERNLASFALVDLKLAPFIDVARIGGVFVDAGIDFRISFKSLITFSLSVGRDLQEGKTVLFTNLTR